MILVWAPWLSGRDHIEEIRQAEGFTNFERSVSADLFCRELTVAWKPFGRDVRYCDRAEWSIDLMGRASLVSFESVIKDEDRAERIIKLLSEKKDGPAEECRQWNVHHPVHIEAEFVGNKKEREVRLPRFGTAEELVMSPHLFRYDNREFDIVMPLDEEASSRYEEGNIYRVDLNDVCVSFKSLGAGVIFSDDWKQFSKAILAEHE